MARCKNLPLGSCLYLRSALSPFTFCAHHSAPINYETDKCISTLTRLLLFILFFFYLLLWIKCPRIRPVFLIMVNGIQIDSTELPCQNFKTFVCNILITDSLQPAMDTKQEHIPLLLSILCWKINVLRWIITQRCHLNFQTR